MKQIGGDRNVAQESDERPQPDQGLLDRRSPVAVGDDADREAARGGRPDPFDQDRIEEEGFTALEVDCADRTNLLGLVEDALVWLRPLVGLLSDISVSTDLLHSNEAISPESRNILAACEQIGIPASTISCEVPTGIAGRSPESALGAPVEGGETPRPLLKDVAVGRGDILFRGRAAVRLASNAPHKPWSSFDECPYEDLEEPGRVHLDPWGNLHLCQGLVMGNLFRHPLTEILETYQAADHPIAGPLAGGGPAELVRVYDVPHAADYADACHLCYAAREQLRPRFPQALAPDAMYGVGLM